MGKKIYVGNLPFSVTLEKLKELFSPYGEIEDAIVMANKFTGRSRGFGFVTFVKESDAKKALAEMNNKSVEGRELRVKEARPLKEISKEAPKDEKPTEKEGEEKPKEESKVEKPTKEPKEDIQNTEKQE